MKNEWMSRLRLMLVLLLMVLVSVPAAARKKPRPRKVQPVVTVSLNENDAKRFNYFFLEAVRQQHLGNYAGAFDLFRHCLEINPSSPETYFSLSAYYSEMRNDSAMLAVMKKAAELSPLNYTYLERLGQAYLRIQAMPRPRRSMSNWPPTVLGAAMCSPCSCNSISTTRTMANSSRRSTAWR